MSPDEVKRILEEAVEDARRIADEWEKRAREAEMALELALRDNARLVDDRTDAENWRRYVAVAGPKRAALYVVPPENKEDEH